MSLSGPTPRISFGIIVLNGEPFTKYCLRSIYPFAHQIIVVEGAVEAAAGIATLDGHSTDGTLESLRQFKETEDPENKVTIVTKDGFRSEKDEMSRAYANLATGDYLWQVDIDEFYKSEDMAAVMDMLSADPSISSVSFEQIQFWGGFSYFADGWYLRIQCNECHRIFRWGQGFVYARHRPPTVLNREGVSTRDGMRIDASETARRGIFMYHYSFVFPRQVLEKCDYYGKAEWAGRKKALQWAREVFFELRKPFRVHNVYQYPGWLERYRGGHPAQIEALRADVQSGRLQIDTRREDDIERLLELWWYRLGRAMLKRTVPLAWLIRAWLVFKKAGRGLVTAPRETWRLILERASCLMFRS